MAASGSNISMSPSPGLLRNEMVLEPEENLRRQILSLFSAEWAGDCDWLERELLDSRRHIAPTPFTGNDKQL
jgi:hypothetical protein